jgi:hypothetical protein
MFFNLSAGISKVFIFIIFLSLSVFSYSQTSTVTLCESPNLFVSNGLSLTPGINFTGSVPVGNVVTDVRISVTWSRRQTNCAGANGTDDVSEVEMSLELANQLKNNHQIEATVDLDINSNKKYKSFIAHDAAVGMIKGYGFVVRTKPDAWAASAAADLLCKG